MEHEGGFILVLRSCETTKKEVWQSSTHGVYRTFHPLLPKTPIKSDAVFRWTGYGGAPFPSLSLPSILPSNVQQKCPALVHYSINLQLNKSLLHPILDSGCTWTTNLGYSWGISMNWGNGPSITWTSFGRPFGIILEWLGNEREFSKERVGERERDAALTDSPPLPFWLNSDDKVLFDDTQPMDTVNPQLIRANVNYAEVRVHLSLSLTQISWNNSLWFTCIRTCSYPTPTLVLPIEPWFHSSNLNPSRTSIPL